MSLSGGISFTVPYCFVFCLDFYGIAVTYHDVGRELKMSEEQVSSSRSGSRQNYLPSPLVTGG